MEFMLRTFASVSYREGVEAPAKGANRVFCVHVCVHCFEDWRWAKTIGVVSLPNQMIVMVLKAAVMMIPNMFAFCFCFHTVFSCSMRCQRS